MANKIDQIYEDYWAYTAAWTDLNGDKFLNVLRCCINFFDAHDINTVKYNILFSPNQA